VRRTFMRPCLAQLTAKVKVVSGLTDNRPRDRSGGAVLPLLARGFPRFRPGWPGPAVVEITEFLKLDAAGIANGDAFDRDGHKEGGWVGSGRCSSCSIQQATWFSLTVSHRARPVALVSAFRLARVGFTEADQHEPFEKPGAHLFWTQSGEGSLEYEGRRFALRRGHNVWLVDMSKPRAYVVRRTSTSPLPAFALAARHSRVWHEELAVSHI